MDAARFAQLKALLAEALARPPAEREDWLRARCAEDAALLAEALSLLALDSASDAGELTAAVAARVGRAAAAQLGADHPERIGGYRILGLLGEGGMGAVYRAQQAEPLEREVALKIIHRSAGGAAALARFGAERQALASMDHPHIARVFDAGTTEAGQPYFTMELVEGLPLTRYCDEHRLPLPARLALFRAVCLAVQHAHLRGIIHRDLKPSNILVCAVDGQPAPKIIDFGIAKAVAEPLGGEDPRTEIGALIGTLEYMSPEQARGDPAAIDTRTDVYSLGVLLYELISGALPFAAAELRAASPLDARQRLQTVEPPRPSQRLESAEPAALAAAAARSAELRALRRRLRGDLDWVVMRAIEKEPARRYQSAEALAREIERIQCNEPVSAGPPALRYRAGKFVRRHRLGVLAGAAVLVALLVGSGLALNGFLRATRAQQRAEAEAASARAINDFLTEMLVAVTPDKARGREITVREILGAAAERMQGGERFAGAPEVEAALSFTIGDTYLALGEYQVAIPYLERALGIYRQLLPESDERLPVTIDRIGMAHWFLGQLEISLLCAKEVLGIRERTVGRRHAEYSASLGNIGNTYADMGRPEQAERFLREALAIDREVLREDQGDLLAISLNNLATVLADQEEFAEAAALHRESLALRRRFDGDPSPAVAAALTNLGFTLDGAGELAAADSTLRAGLAMAELIFGSTHLRTGIALTNLASPQRKLGRLGEAEALLTRALAIFQASTGPESWRVGAVRSGLGQVFLASGRPREGERELETAWRIQSRALGAGSRAARRTAAVLAAHYANSGRPALAATWQGRAAAKGTASAAAPQS